LTSDQLTIKKSLDIEGPGAGLLAISGDDTNRVFAIDAGLTVSIAGLTITHGRAGGAGNGGGGILNVGSTLTLVNDVLSDNQALGQSAYGGAIRNLNGATLTVIRSSFFGNCAIASDGGEGLGGGIENGGAQDGSTATISACTFTGNEAVGGDGGEVQGNHSIIGRGSGGAIFDEGGATLQVMNSTLTRNRASAGNGGSGGQGASLYFVDAAGGGGIGGSHAAIMTISGSTFAYNEAIGGSHASGGTTGYGQVGTAGGGGLLNTGWATVTNSTFVGNEALGGSGNGGGRGFLIFGRAAGGAISNAFFVTPVTLTVSDCTLSNNQAVGGAGNRGGAFPDDAAGGGLANLNGARATVTGTTLTGNRVVGGAGGLAANGGNGFGGGLFSDGTSSLTVTGSTISSNQATGGVAGRGGVVGQGIGGGVYFAIDGVVCLDAATVANVSGNTASTSNDDIYGDYTTC
jgi:hypothetical protein